MNYYVGLSLAAGSSMDSGVAVIDEDNKIILIDKLYKMNDVIFFFEITIITNIIIFNF